jgi:propanediol dehydratase large subunit
MRTPYTSFPSNSKVWVYQSSRPLTESDFETIKKYTDTFLENWDSHEKIVKSDYTILHNLFLVFFVDEDGDRLCGSAPGKLIRVIKELEQDLQIELMNRMNMAYLENEQAHVIKMSDFPQLIQEGKINADTIVFDNTVSTKELLDTKWQSALKDSWQSRFL